MLVTYNVFVIVADCYCYFWSFFGIAFHKFPFAEKLIENRICGLHPCSRQNSSQNSSEPEETEIIR